LHPVMVQDLNAASAAPKLLPGAMPTCPLEHPLEEKVVAGSMFRSSKRCHGCEAALKTGTVRHSCKQCGYHLCLECHNAVREALLWSEITVTLYRAQIQGQAEDTFQVTIERCATVGALKNRIFQLYGIPPLLQQLRRDVDDREPLADADQLSVDEGDVLYFSTAGAMDPLSTMMQSTLGPLANGLAPLANELADAFAAGMAGVAEEGRIMMESLERTTHSLTFVMPPHRGCPERRCTVEVSAMACISEVIDMVKLELNVENQALALEFAGERLPPGARLHSVGLRGGDTVMVVPTSASPGA